jgi:hypothetical protein
MAAKFCLILCLGVQGVLADEPKKELTDVGNPLITKCSVKNKSLREVNRVGNIARKLEREGQFEIAADCYVELLKGDIDDSFELNFLESITFNYSKAGMCSHAEEVIPKYEKLFKKLWVRQGETSPAAEVNNPQLNAMRQDVKDCQEPSGQDET